MCSSETAGVGRIWNFEFRRIPFEQKEMCIRDSQQRLNTVVGELLVAVGSHATVVQPVHQFLHSCAIVVPLKGFYHKGSFQRIDLKMCIRDRGR